MFYGTYKNYEGIDVVEFQTREELDSWLHYEDEFAKRGVNIVIYANQLLRAAFPAMQNAAKSILKHHRAHEIDEELLSIKDIITLIDEL